MSSFITISQGSPEKHNLQNGDLLEGLTGCGPPSPIAAIEKFKNAVVVQSTGSGCLSKVYLLESQRIPRELLVFSLCWNPKEDYIIDYNSSREMPGQQDR